MDLDCIVIGGGAAGLSAALVLGRARRRTLLVDAGEQSNRPSHGIGGLLGHDGLPPAELYARGHAELAAYPGVEVRAATAVDAEAEPDGFAVALSDGTRATARRVLLATGMAYARPALPGLEALWGETVFHCPFCDAWELRDRPLAVLGNTPHAVMQARLLTAWSDDVVLLTDGPGALDATATAQLASAGVVVDEREVRALRADDGRLAGVRFADGSELARAGLLVHTPLSQRGGLAEALGAALTDKEQLVVDERQQTTVPGLYAAGDVASMPNVSFAIADGSRAAIAIVQDLVLGTAAHAHAPAAAP
jgi:thioredoxin reductase